MYIECSVREYGIIRKMFETHGIDYELELLEGKNRVRVYTGNEMDMMLQHYEEIEREEKNVRSV